LKNRADLRGFLKATKMEDNNQFELGAGLGRNQAFHLLANHCLATLPSASKPPADPGKVNGIGIK
jgi:hypothetical protein